ENVKVFEHTFISHSDQWTFAIQRTEIHTRWILVLDADLVLSKEFVDEMKNLKSSEEVAGYEADFQICVFGHPLPRSIYPPRIILCRPGQTSFYQDGHTQRLVVSGDVARLRTSIRHDDRKTLTHWLAAQDKYAKLERDKLLATRYLSLGGAD